MSMENFFNWMSKPIPKEEVIIWFNVHNMNYEKIELCGDIFKSLNHIILDTYMGEDKGETKIFLTQEDKESHFEWCWKKMLENFNKENIKIKNLGEHKNYFQDFFMETFYNQSEKNVKDAIPTFIIDVFDVEKPFSKSDLDILTELYKLMEKNIE
jgi:hypothetical protein